MRFSQTPSPRLNCFRFINDEGALLIQSGCYSDAAKLISKSLRNLRIHIMVSVSANQERERNASNSLKSSMPSWCCCCGDADSDGPAHILSRSSSLVVSPDQVPMTAPTSSRRRIQHSSSIFHSQMNGSCGNTQPSAARAEDEPEPFLFSVPLTVESGRKCHELSAETIAFMMMFNLALCYDLLAESSHGCESDKRTALRLYTLAHEMEVNERTNLEVPPLYLCGMANNMARLYSCFHDREGVEWSLVNLTQILIHCRTRAQQYRLRMGDDGTSSYQQLMEDYYLGAFSRSASVLVLPGSSTAAAA